MNTGKLDKRITIQKLTIVENVLGDSVNTWTDLKTVWASLTNLHGSEYFAAAAVQSEETIKFGIRYIKELDKNINIEKSNTSKIFRIKFKNTIYDIKFIDDIKYGHSFMEIQALEVVNNVNT